MSIQIQSFNQILGNMIRKVVAETPLSDINPGSVFLSLLEACASNDFDNNVAILNILELLNIDSIRNSDLDNKAADFGLTRNAAVAATGTVRLLNTNITKQSTSLYSLKPAPISGQTVLFVNSTAGWSPSGSLYIGRGTNSFEGPIAYTSITVFATYSQVNLGSALQKDHLASDTVVNGQGQPDRVVNAGTTVKIPANNQNPDILYRTIRDAVIPAGEDHVDDVLVLAVTPGSQGNALINTIRQFDTVPFLGAAVTNTVAFSTGSDIETDVELRNRIKSYAASLARGTSPAILSAVLGISDPDENKQVASAVLTQPVSVGQPSILYIDDGSGFQPSEAGQAVDILLAKANGTEEFLQLANYPLPRAQVVNGNPGPFALLDQMFFRVAVDGTEETVVFTTSDFANISVATLPEIIAAFNTKATLYRARLANDSQNALIFPLDPDAEIIQVIPLRATDNEALYANNLLNFPTKEVSYIALFQNSTRLRQRSKLATVETVPFASWNLLTTGNLSLSVDGTPAQDRAFALSDFPGATSFNLLTLDNWVNAFNQKFAGITASATPSQTMQITSNRTGSTASVEIIGGSYQAQMFADNVQTATGQSSQFEINRQTGNIRILTGISEGDTISAGVADAKGFVVSSPTNTGVYDLDADAAGRQAQMVVCVDATICDEVNVNLAVDQELVITNQGSSVMRIMAPDINVFRFVQPGHYIYIAHRGGIDWVSSVNSGLFKVITRGDHLTALTDTYIEVLNNDVVGETVTVIDIADFAAFHTDVYPQLWRSSFLNNPTSASLSDLVNSIGIAILGAKASIFRSNSVKITSTTEDGGSIAVPVTVGTMTTVVAATAKVQANNAPLIANKVASKDMVGFIKLSAITSQNTYLGRAIVPAEWHSVATSVDPDAFPYSGPYSEVVDVNGSINALDLSDLVVFSHGNNAGQVRSLGNLNTGSSEISTQQGIPRTLLGHIAGDDVQFFQSLKMSADDNVVVVMDQDATIKTIDINAARTGQVNSGSQSLSFVPTSTEFSANDTDNEPGVDFGTLNVWGIDINGTDFSDYRVLMRARNWYASGGTGSSAGKFLVRAVEYGLNGENFHFSLEYPSNPSLANTVIYTNTPSFNMFSYFFGSGTDRPTAIPSGTTVTVTGPYPDTTTNFPGGASSSGNYYDLAWGAGSFTTVVVNDILSTLSGCGFDPAFIGQFAIRAKSGSTIRIFNPSASAGTETVSNPGGIHIFPLANTTVAEIITAINASNILVAAAVSSGSTVINKSTFDDQYAYVSNATALAFGHNPTTGNRGRILLFDGAADVKIFANSNPNFVIKAALNLNGSGVSSAIYRMDLAINEDGSHGEYIKLVPATIKNVKHHFTQKALSQLPIVADVSIADNGKRVQIVSKSLGGSGAIQIVGGNANRAQASIIGPSVVTSDGSGSYLLGVVSAFPNSYSKNDVVKVSNPRGVQRFTDWVATNTISVAALVSNHAEYYWDSVVTNFVSATTIAITDVSSSYTDYSGTPLASGMVWRYTHSTGLSETLANVKPGMQVLAFGTLTGWASTNKAKLPGDGVVAGLPIIAVDDVAHHFDVINPFGVAMSATAIGSSSSVNICPTPRLRWHLGHTAPAPIISIARVSNVITVTTTADHGLNTGNSVIISDSFILADGTYGTVTVTGPRTYTFANTGSDTSETSVGAFSIKSTATRTAYRLEKLGFNNLVRLERVSGDAVRFADAGVAVDDYLVVGGTTFSSLNSGVFRVVAVDNNSLVFENPGATNNQDRITQFNNNSLAVTWTANTNVVTGVAGSFKYVTTGAWVKKQEDDDSLYLQVTGSDTGNYHTATIIFLGQLYTGITGSAFGVAYDMTSGYQTGVLLKTIDDIAVYEGDAAFKTDQLNVQNIANATWFSPNNTGSFGILEIGNNPSDFRPFVRVTNALAVTEASKALAAALQGFYITENDAYKYSSYRTIQNSAISSLNELQRNIYMLPDARSYKINQANNSLVQHVGKFGYDLNLSVGTDGYLFYTGLLRRVQRTIDGFSPDPVTFAERRAVGSRVETLPPLIRNILINITVTTNEGFTIQDISDNVKSAIIDYVNGLGVGQDVILSAIIAAVMRVKGVAAVTFTSPAPSTERVTIASNEKALITASAIGIT